MTVHVQPGGGRAGGAGHGPPARPQCGAPGGALAGLRHWELRH